MRAGLDRLRGLHFAYEQLVARRGARGMDDAQSGAGIALRVQIDHKDSEPLKSERRRKVHRGRRLADATLLVRDGDHAAERRLRQRHRMRMKHLARSMRGRPDGGLLRGDRRVGGGEIVVVVDDLIRTRTRVLLRCFT